MLNDIFQALKNVLNRHVAATECNEKNELYQIECNEKNELYQIYLCVDMNDFDLSSEMYPSLPFIYVL